MEEKIIAQCPDIYYSTTEGAKFVDDSGATHIFHNYRWHIIDSTRLDQLIEMHLRKMNKYNLCTYRYVFVMEEVVYTVTIRSVVRFTFPQNPSDSPIDFSKIRLSDVTPYRGFWDEHWLIYKLLHKGLVTLEELIDDEIPNFKEYDDNYLR